MRPPLRTTAALLLAMAAALWLPGCGSIDQGPPLMRPAAQVNFEQAHLKEAKRQASAGDLAQAAFHWEVLTVLRPDMASYAEQLAQVRAEIARKVPELLRAARQAQSRGAHEEATQRYLAVLALQPGEQSAAQALRAIERERVRREHLGRYAARPFAPRMPMQPKPLTSRP